MFKYTILQCNYWHEIEKNRSPLNVLITLSCYCFTIKAVWLYLGCERYMAAPQPPDQLPCTYKWLVLSEHI